jgi:hypothetical protein
VVAPATARDCRRVASDGCCPGDVDDEDTLGRSRHRGAPLEAVRARVCVSVCVCVCVCAKTRWQYQHEKFHSREASIGSAVDTLSTNGRCPTKQALSADVVRSCSWARGSTARHSGCRHAGADKKSYVREKYSARATASKPNIDETRQCSRNKHGRNLCEFQRQHHAYEILHPALYTAA